LLVLLTLATAHADVNFIADGGEYGIAGTLLGEQVYPQASIRPSGGYVVWQDNITDGDGLGISARRLNAGFSGSLSSFRVNQTGLEDQERPVVAMLGNGGAVFAWEGGRQGFQHVYARVISSAGTWDTGDILVNANTNSYQMETAIAALTNGNAVIAYSSSDQAAANSMRDVYFQIITPTGTKFGAEARANQATSYNQRAASVAPLSDGRFVVVWVSEHQRFENSVDIYGRIFNDAGVAVTSEFLVNSGTNICANPSVAAANDGGFAVSWMENDLQTATNGWDVIARPFNSSAVGGVTRRVNTYLPSDQLAPKIAAVANTYLVVWTSARQDGSREGVYGQYLNGDGALAGEEFRVNTTTASQQVYPVVVSDGAERFVTIWSGFVGGAASFELFAQRSVSLVAPLTAPQAPYVNILGSTSLSVTWPEVQGQPVAYYEVYADGSVTPIATATNSCYWNAIGLSPASTHRYQIAYVLEDARRSPLSTASTNTTYGSIMYSGIPVEWMAQHFGEEWPSATADSDGDGSSNRDEFLRGTDPNDPDSVLKQFMRTTAQGMFLDWNTIPGLVYQVESAAEPAGPWTLVGGPRFAAGTTDSLFVGGSSAAFYRVGRLR